MFVRIIFDAKYILLSQTNKRNNKKSLLKKERDIYSGDDFFLDLSRFERKEIIYKGGFSKLYKFIEKETGKNLYRSNVNGQNEPHFKG